jgi:AcrR family transcriptional regulator
LIEETIRRPVLRGTHARDRVLAAALEVLAESGLAGFNMEAVAHRAGASKPTLYRRWRSTGELLVAAMDAGFRPIPLPVTGDLRSGLVELLATFEGLLEQQHFPGLLAAFMDAAERDPRLKSLHADLTEHRREPLRLLLDRARKRGEIRADADIELAVDLLAGPLFYRRFVAHRGYPGGYVNSVVDHVLRSVGYTFRRAPNGSMPPPGLEQSLAPPAPRSHRESGAPLVRGGATTPAPVSRSSKH